MTKSLSLLLLAIVFLSLNACRKVTGEGPVVTENRPVNNFTAIDSRISGNLHFTPAPVSKLEISAQRNILELIETVVANGELTIRFKNNVNIRSHEDIDVLVSGPDVSAFALSGSGNLQTSGDYAVSSCRFSISGSGDIRVARLSASTVDAAISGSGSIHIAEGSVTQQTLKISGSGSINLQNVPGKIATVTTSGSGTTRVAVSDQLDARISGSGNILYLGRPAITARISGSGKVAAL